MTAPLQTLVNLERAIKKELGIPEDARENAQGRVIETLMNITFRLQKAYETESSDENPRLPDERLRIRRHIPSFGIMKQIGLVQKSQNYEGYELTQRARRIYDSLHTGGYYEGKLSTQPP